MILLGGQIRTEVTNLIPATPTNITMVRVGDIKVGYRFREANSDKVEHLARNLKIGVLLNPIIVTSGNKLVSGLHRLEAYKLLKIKEIPCRVMDIDETQAKLLEIDENLIRNELSELELGEALIEKQSILEELHMRGKPGYEQDIKDRAKFARLPGGITKEISQNIGLSPRSVQLKTQITRNLNKKVRNYIRDNYEIANNQSVLLELSQVKDENEQLNVAKKAVEYIAKHGNQSVTNAIKDLKKLQQKDKEEEKQPHFQDEEDEYYREEKEETDSCVTDATKEICITVDINSRYYAMSDIISKSLGITIKQFIEKCIEEKANVLPYQKLITDLGINI